MQHKRPPVPVIVVLLLAVLVGGYFGLQALFSENNGGLQASGTIEAVDIIVSPEMAGRVVEVLADEGEVVESEYPLLHLDESLLAAQRSAAEAQLEAAIAGAQAAQEASGAARTQYQLTLEAALTQDEKSRLRDWYTEEADRFDQPDWYFTRDEQILAAQAQVDFAWQQLEEAREKLAGTTESLEASAFVQAEKRLLEARQNYLITKDVDERAENSVTSDVPKGRYNRMHCGTNDGYFVDNARLTNSLYGCTGDEYLSDSSQVLFDRAGDELEAAQKAYNDLLDADAAGLVFQARADVSVAQEQYYSALEYLRDLRLGASATSVVASEGLMQQAQAAAEQAQKVVDQAQANLELIDVQITKLTLYAPMDGTILTRNVEPGEYVQPGAMVFTLANLETLTITVYVPEDRYGQISLGQHAAVTVDSFPGEAFSAVVINISDQAEYTPRNVQTVEGRSATVYAVKLQVDDPRGRLKPGMPADVTFHK
ncbi:MAG: efflux RND transporter periplasmic adaptor subunit [Anaerolineales bacterium]|nr:efflux RND transporter periplasmic adaptor subunit [Anaerolineales bacterium]